MPRTAIKYIHPRIGEIWICEGTTARELLEKRDIKALNALLDRIGKD